MTVYYADTSALAKRYLVEVGTPWVLSWIEPAAGNVTIVCDQTPVEMFSLLARRQRENTLTPANAAILQRDFLWHVEHEYIVVLIDGDIFVQARDLVTRHKLRTLDAIQLACAQQAASILSTSLTFVSADKNLLAAAATEGFPVDDPNAHP